MTLLIGIPYLNMGRDPNLGLDCWGLLREFYHRYLNIQLPSYADKYQDSLDKESTQAAIENNYSDWVLVTEPKFGDAILCRLAGHPCHVGVYMGNNTMLHTQNGHNSGIEVIDGVKWKNRIDGYYRHASLIGE